MNVSPTHAHPQIARSFPPYGDMAASELKARLNTDAPSLCAATRKVEKSAAWVPDSGELKRRAVRPTSTTSKPYFPQLAQEQEEPQLPTGISRQSVSSSKSPWADDKEGLGKEG